MKALELVRKAVVRTVVDVNHVADATVMAKNKDTHESLVSLYDNGSISREEYCMRTERLLDQNKRVDGIGCGTICVVNQETRTVEAVYSGHL